VIVGLGCYFSSSRAVPLSRELDPLFRSEVRKPPRRIGGTEHLAGLGAATPVPEPVFLCLGHNHRRGVVRVWLSTLLIWRFRADSHARFLERMRAPGRPGEPQSTGSEQRRYCQEQMFWFHCFLLFDSSVTFTFDTALCGDFSELAFHLERRRGILVRSAREQE